MSHPYKVVLRRKSLIPRGKVLEKLVTQRKKKHPMPARSVCQFAREGSGAYRFKQRRTIGGGDTEYAIRCKREGFATQRTNHGQLHCLSDLRESIVVHARYISCWSILSQMMIRVDAGILHKCTE